jgi:hypothetical protein
MILLISGCSYSDFVVHPADWKTCARITGPWYIFYRFYDPAFRNTPKWGLKVTIKGMNRATNLTDRRRLTIDLIKNETEHLHAGNNPITNANPASAGAISPNTSLIDALTWAAKEIPVEPNTRKDLRSILKYVGQAAAAVNLRTLPIGQARRLHVRALLNQVGKVKKHTPVTSKGKPTGQTRDTWTASNFNFYRANLGVLFNYLMENDVIEANPALNLKKAKATRRVREVLQDDQRPLVDAYLAGKDPAFHRFLHIFYHQLTREVELLRVKGKDVNLKIQKFKRLQKKGREFKEDYPTIPDIAVPYWEKALEGCGPNDYVFSRGLKPGKAMIRPEQIARRWRKVKKALGITADFYSNKHLKASALAEEIGDKPTSEQMGHAGTGMLIKFYDTTRPAREHEIKKRSGKPF